MSLVSAPKNLLSKSVRIIRGFVPTSFKNFLIVRGIEVVIFFRGYILRNFVALSINIRLYLIPPMAVVGPCPMSICQTSLYAYDVLDGDVLRRLDRSVAEYPSSDNGGPSCCLILTLLSPTVGMYFIKLLLL